MISIQLNQLIEAYCINGCKSLRIVAASAVFFLVPLTGSRVEQALGNICYDIKKK
jgi:hypothetical protein